MGRNRIERARYAYIHEKKELSYNIQYRIKRQFWRLNWNIGQARKERINKRIKELNKQEYE